MAKIYLDEDGNEVKARPRKPGRKVNRTVQQKKDTIISYLQQGLTAAEAARDLGITKQMIQYYRNSDHKFRADYDRVKLMSNPDTAAAAREEMPDFPTFCEEYLDTKLFRHQLQWYDVLEGRPPRDLHPSQIYKQGDPGMIIVNTPPEHAKSTTITVNYTTWRICQDPNIRIIIVSQTQEMAKRFLRAIKDRLAGANHAYKKLQVDFGPEGGFDANSASWTADSIYVNSEARDSGEPTPTVQALGMNGQIYGNRADLIILDDTVTGKNAHEYEKQIDWIQREVINRLTYPGGTLLLVGTRLAPVELYSEIQKPEWYGQDEESPWTYLTQPAVLEFAESPDDWDVLAPWTNRPPVSLGTRKLVEPNADGLYPWHSGKALARRRATSSPLNWKMVYQQEQVVEDAIFPADKVAASIDGMRAAGLMSSGAPGHRPHGMDGLYVVGGFDPAVTGYAAAVVLGVDRMSGMRYVLDVWTAANQKPHGLVQKIKDWTVKYSMHEWVIEKNMHQVIHDAQLKQFLGSRGTIIKEHFTGNNKNDIEFGVASMSMLFEGSKEGQGLIRLPSRSQNEGVKALVEQLTTWFPQTKAKHDTVMALWFAETRARELCNNIETVFHMDNIYQSARDKSKRTTVDLDYLSQVGSIGGEGAWWN
jgi:Terminase RNaseH-like domain